MVGHSFGTSEVLRVLAEAGRPVRGVVLLAAVWPAAKAPAPDRLFSLPEFVRVHLALLVPLLHADNLSDI